MVVEQDIPISVSARQISNMWVYCHFVHFYWYAITSYSRLNNQQRDAIMANDLFTIYHPKGETCSTQEYNIVDFVPRCRIFPGIYFFHFTARTCSRCKARILFSSLKGNSCLIQFQGKIDISWSEPTAKRAQNYTRYLELLFLVLHE